MRDPDRIKLHLDRLKARAEASHSKLQQKFPHVASKLEKLGFNLKNLRQHAAQVLASAVLATSVIALGPKVMSELKPPAQVRQLEPKEVNSEVKTELSALLNGYKIGAPLPPTVEDKAHDVILQKLGINAVAQLEGNHLNTSYGYMGAEQHLPRYPGDTVSQHDEFLQSGITPGLGGWGYFAQSKNQMTEDAFLREKYYVAVQTLYLPNWNKDLKYLVNWYRYRKVLVVNPNNGRSIVAVVGDAGPAAWTGKQFGGSPEVMAHLGLNVGKQKGAVLMFFVDDQNKPLALGPVMPSSGVYLTKK